MPESAPGPGARGRRPPRVAPLRRFPQGGDPLADADAHGRGRPAAAAPAQLVQQGSRYPDPHSRFTVAPGISTGSPASSTPIRATLRLSSPAWLAAPQYTSSTEAGSSQALRRMTALITSAVRWSGRTPASAPLIFPTGVLHASTANTAVIGHLPLPESVTWPVPRPVAGRHHRDYPRAAGCPQQKREAR